MSFMQRITKYFSSKFYVLLVLGIIWITALFFLKSKQGDYVPKNEESTAQVFNQIQENENENVSEPITPLPEKLDLNPQKIALGFKLFNETQLSANNTISCATCHDLKRGGMDNLPLSHGMNNAVGERNAPTVLNSGFNFRQFWDGRAETLEQQVDGPLLNPKEMANSWDAVIKTLSNSAEYSTLFQEIYGKKDITPNEVREVIATFERALITPNSRFDLWLKGHDDALSTRQKNGYKLFKSYGCVSCHHGVNIGGAMFEKIGVFNDYYSTHSTLDKGRFNVTTDENSLYEFKIPTLRNVALTKPYMHDGSVETLRKAIDLMAYYQLGIKLSDSAITDIEDFLNSLTGDTPNVLK
jgi:cytochrome c peroxidase